MASIKQGDAYGLPFQIRQEDGLITAETLDTVEVVEVYLGQERKEYRAEGDGEIYFDSEQNAFIYPLTQQETFAMPPRMIPADIRVKFKGEQVVGIQEPLFVSVKDAVSRKEL